MLISKSGKQVWIEPKVGKIIVGDEYKGFIKKSQGAKFKYLREQLDYIYPESYTRQKIVDLSGLSKPGLINIEEEKQKVIRKGNITTLSRIYNVDEKFITDSKYQNCRQGFLIANWEDSNEFFKNYEEEFIFRHNLDPRGGIVGYSLEDESEDESNDSEIDTDGYDVIDNGNGEYELDRVSLEVSLKLIQTATGRPFNSNFLNVKAVVSVQDANHINSLIHRELKLLEERHRNYINIKNEYDEFKTLTKAEVAINFLTDPSEKEDTIKVLYDVRRKLRNNREANQT